ncbi:MAG: phosphoglucosamine mutase, partial [Planctomycetaceae bacterium]|nr:phosphoglucosamine mutase [Planctomycetaceae bacterium]
RYRAPAGLEGMRIVVDCAHGAGYKSTPVTLRELGAEVIAYGNQPDGKNINAGCGSMHPQYLSHKVQKHAADLGIAHDGDADRVILCDENGGLVDGDGILAITALDLLKRDALNHNTLVGTVMTNSGLETVIQEAGGKLHRTSVGDKHVIDAMIKGGYNLGGEPSGHIVFGDHGTAGDGLVAALQVLRIMRDTRQSLSELASCWTRHPQVLTNIPVNAKPPFEELNGVMTLVQQAEADLAPAGGRLLLRYSGTEPKARLLLEGPEESPLKDWSEKISSAIEKQTEA